MSQRNEFTIRLPQPKTMALISVAICAAFAIILIALAATPMKFNGGNCGTIFASSDTWKYDSNLDAANDFAREFVRSPSDLDDFASSLVDNMMSDLAYGSAVYDECERRHESRLIWISVVGVGAVLFGIAAIYLFRQHRRSVPSSPADQTDADPSGEPTP